MQATTTLKRTRTGTAKRIAGKRTAEKIVQTAYEILQTGGHGDFSMRKIAERAEIRLANLQYYFPKMEDLIKALIDYVGGLYDARYKQQLAIAEDTPMARFVAAIELNYEDINNLQTRHFFIQLWSYLGMADNYSGKLLVELYQPQLRQLSERVKELNPAISDHQAMLGAELITALVEGLLVTTVSPSKSKRAAREFKQALINSCLTIAQGG